MKSLVSAFLKARPNEHLGVFCLYSLVTLFFFKDIIFEELWFSGDFFRQNFPNRVFADSQLKSGSFPLWNPHIFSGMPFFADIQTAVLYPFNLILSLFFTGKNILSNSCLYPWAVNCCNLCGDYFNIRFKSSSMDYRYFCSIYVSYWNHCRSF